LFVLSDGFVGSLVQYGTHIKVSFGVEEALRWWDAAVG
jgi:hypothetical protein